MCEESNSIGVFIGGGYFTINHLLSDYCIKKQVHILI